MPNGTSPLDLSFNGPGDFHQRIRFGQDVAYQRVALTRSDGEGGGNNLSGESRTNFWLIAAPEEFLIDHAARDRCKLAHADWQPRVSFMFLDFGGASGAWGRPTKAGVWHFFVHLGGSANLVISKEDRSLGPAVFFNATSPFAFQAFEIPVTVESPATPYRHSFHQDVPNSETAWLLFRSENAGGPWVNVSTREGVRKQGGEPCWNQDATFPLTQDALNVNALFLTPPREDVVLSGTFEAGATANPPETNIWAYRVPFG